MKLSHHKEYSPSRTCSCGSENARFDFVPDTYTINNIEFVAFRYAMYRKEIDLLEQSLEAMGLTNINDVFNVSELDFSAVKESDFFVCSHSEKRLLDELLKTTVDEEVVE